MTAETTENQHTDISLKKLWKLPLIQEILSAFLLAILSGSVVSYFLSKIFIKDYLSGIGFDGLIYQALIDTSTVSSFIFGITIIAFSFLLTFIIPSVVLRNLYHEKINLFEEYHKENKRKIGLRLFLCLFMPVFIFIILACFKWNIYFYFSSCIIPLLCFREIEKNVMQDKKIEIAIIAFLFSLSITLSFFPFIHIFKAIYHVISDDIQVLILVGIVWIIYSFLYGIRISDNKPIQYVIDILLSLLIFYFIMIYSSHTIKNPIAEFIGLKDKQPYIYAISEKDFAEIKHNLDTHWHHYQDSINDKENILLYAKRKSDNQVYLYTKIIFRNDKIAVICPPDYNIIYQRSEVCFIANQEYLIPTTLTKTHLSNSSLFYEIKEGAKNQYRTSNIENQK
ncbi:hypothetical protein [Moraxella oblonga]|uniref:hypothetical protein n=1 Tax=Moraxella oblonga TaxID=200413 RepID=UPI000836F89B|nr:hypothetical protein [Moraxella oblonga]